MTIHLFFSKSIPDVVNTLEEDTGVAFSWFENDEMIGNQEKFHAILLRKSQIDTSEQTEETVKPSGVTLDYRLYSDLHISYICKKQQKD